MKRFLIFLLCFLCIFTSVFADEIYDPADVPDNLPKTVEEINNSDEWEVTGIEVQSLSPVTPSDAKGLKKVLLDFLGDYDAIIVEYAYKNQNNTYYSYLREVQPDYVWIASFILLCLFIFCLFRLGGALIG